MATSNSKSKTPSLASQLEAAHVRHQDDLLVISLLREDLARSESRRAFEGAAYRAKLASAKPAKRVAPSMDMSIDDADLTPGQRAIRAHRASLAV